MTAKRVMGVALTLGELGGDIARNVNLFMMNQLSDPPQPRHWMRVSNAYYSAVVCQLFWRNFQLPIKNEPFSDPDARGLLDYVSDRVENIDSRFYKQCEVTRLLIPQTDIVVVCEGRDVYLIEK